MTRPVPVPPADGGPASTSRLRHGSVADTPHPVPPGDNGDEADPGEIVAGAGEAGDAGRDAPPADLPPVEPVVTVVAEQPPTRPPAAGATGRPAGGQGVASGPVDTVTDSAVTDSAVTDGTVADATVAEEKAAAEDEVPADENEVPAENAVIDGSADGSAAAAVAVRLDDLARRVEELARLRRHDADLVDRLHAENTRLRAGELTEAMSPLLRGLMRLHDQMTSLGADDGQSVAGILRTQLLQIMDVAVDVRPYTAVVGMPFDPARHVGVRRIGTDDAKRDRTIARTVKPGFVRGESIVVRPAEVEVFRAH
ncbi:nucleotide exchange factor GrpE [Protofrankia coriariae]|uniref:nucleotide exchange factor GrpE n=1 Tax=Protofrankia coriariae TaxID=1562887 RepID=UPI001F3F3256|nr:nucleotide exchange factor GrpE [Protofrankia coriariae]